MADNVRDCFFVQVHCSASEHQEKSASPSPSHVSIKSDQSMNHPRDLKGSSLLQPGGSDFLNEFKKSNRSIDHLVEFKESSSLQQGRSVSPCPSHESMKSNQSMNHPRDLKGSSSLLQPYGSDCLSPSPELQNSSQSIDHLVEFKESRTDLSTQETLKSHLRNKFQCLHEGTTKNSGLIPLNEIYTEVHITEGWCGEINHEHEVRQIEAALRRSSTKDKPIKCNDILKSLLGQDKPIRTVLTKGVAGIGKTVSVQKFILDWAKGKANQDVHLIFPLPFRELNLMKEQKVSLIDLLQLFTHIKQLEISQNESKILLIFDGLDEYRLPLDFDNSVRLCDVNESVPVDVLVTNLIKGNLLPSALIWITSRPSASDLIPSECVDRVTEVRGFSDPQKEEYFRKRISDEVLADKIISHLKSSRSLYIMCHIPVFCWISVTVLERMLGEAESKEIPKTLTQMYTHFLIIQTNIKHQKDYEMKVKDEEMILKLGKLAFEQLVKGNLIFYEEDLRECGIDVAEASVYSGLCTQIFREEHGLHERNVYCFVHMTMQEHLAALYVYLSFINNKINLIDQNTTTSSDLSDMLMNAVDEALASQTGHLDLFLRFLLGLSLASNQALLQRLLTNTGHSVQCTEKTAEYIKHKIMENPSPEKSINLFHCLNELGDHSLVKEVQHFLTSGTIRGTKLSASQWSAVAFVLLTSEQLDVFHMSKYARMCSDIDEVLVRLLPVIEASRTVHFHYCILSAKCCPALASALSSKISCLRELNLNGNGLHDEGATELFHGLESPHCKLEILRLANCKLADKSCSALATALKSKSSSLKELNLNWNNLQDAGVNLLATGLGNSHCKLEILKLRKCGFTDSGCVALATALNSNPCHLKELHLNRNDLGDRGMTLLSGTLENPCCKLEILGMSRCGITDEGCAALASALRSNPSHLKQLDLSENELGDAGLKRLTTGWMSPLCKLETLRLMYCGITVDGCAALALTLRLNPSHLKQLNLSGNKLGDSGVKLLYAGLENPNCKLEKLKLMYCGITDGGCAALASFMKSNSCDLKELYLDKNDLGDSGVKLISAALENPHCKLESLKLWDCDITDQGCIALASALKSNPSHLRNLYLFGNNLGPSGVKLLSALIDDPENSLENFDLY